MIDSSPGSMNEGLGRYIVTTLEELAGASLACIVLAVVFGLLAYRSKGRQRIVWTWLAGALGLLALVPPGIVVYAINH